MRWSASWISSVPTAPRLITTRVDLSAGPQSYVEDCQVCCQPIAIALLLTDAGELREVPVERLGQ